jgi:hypothetical protein
MLIMCTNLVLKSETASLSPSGNMSMAYGACRALDTVDAALVATSILRTLQQTVENVKSVLPDFVWFDSPAIIVRAPR